jgi:hypothetical protein
MSEFLKLLSSSRFKGVVAVVAAVVMYFTPDHIDNIIMTVLGLLGISQLTIVPARPEGKNEDSGSSATEESR